MGLFGLFNVTSSVADDSSKPLRSLYDLTASSIDGEEIKLSKYDGKVILIVNTASKCGFTPQFKGLEEIYTKYSERGFIVLAFPSNDFMEQEPGSSEEIKNFCSTNYNITFPLFAKNKVSGEERQPVYQFLTQESDPKFRGDPGWNFVKFLLNRKGQVVGRYSSMTSPTSEAVLKDIERELSLEMEN